MRVAASPFLRNTPTVSGTRPTPFRGTPPRRSKQHPGRIGATRPRRLGATRPRRFRGRAAAFRRPRPTTSGARSRVRSHRVTVTHTHRRRVACTSRGPERPGRLVIQRALVPLPGPPSHARDARFRFPAQPVIQTPVPWLGQPGSARRAGSMPGRASREVADGLGRRLSGGRQASGPASPARNRGTAPTHPPPLPLAGPPSHPDAHSMTGPAGKRPASWVHAWTSPGRAP